MVTRPVTVIDDGRAIELEAAVRGDSIRLPPAELAARLGWELKPQGLCRGEVCVPVRDRASLVTPEGVELAAFARLVDRPLALDAPAGVAVLGTRAAERAARLVSLEAPDFTLPDLAGTAHSLADHREKKRLLIAWASW
jgi:hypothetical protein